MKGFFLFHIDRIIKCSSIKTVWNCSDLGDQELYKLLVDWRMIHNPVIIRVFHYHFVLASGSFYGIIISTQLSNKQKCLRIESLLK